MNQLNRLVILGDMPCFNCLWWLLGTNGNNFVLDIALYDVSRLRFLLLHDIYAHIGLVIDYNAV